MLGVLFGSLVERLKEWVLWLNVGDRETLWQDQLRLGPFENPMGVTVRERLMIYKMTELSYQYLWSNSMWLIDWRFVPHTDTLCPHATGSIPRLHAVRYKLFAVGTREWKRSKTMPARDKREKRCDKRFRKSLYSTRALDYVVVGSLPTHLHHNYTITSAATGQR